MIPGGARSRVGRVKRVPPSAAFVMVGLVSLGPPYGNAFFRTSRNHTKPFSLSPVLQEVVQSGFRFGDDFVEFVRLQLGYLCRLCTMCVNLSMLGVVSPPPHYLSGRNYLRVTEILISKRRDNSPIEHEIHGVSSSTDLTSLHRLHGQNESGILDHERHRLGRGPHLLRGTQGQCLPPQMSGRQSESQS